VFKKLFVRRMLMKKLTLLGLLMLTLCIPLLVNGCGQKTSKEIILASFDKQVVTANELEKEITELPEWKQDKYKDQAGREEYLTLMAESRMILDVAKKAKLEKNPEIIKQVKEFQDGIMRDELTKREIDDKVKVSDLDVEKYYAENKEKYIEPEMVVATEITVKDEARAKEILDNVKTGADFTEIAKEVDSKGESFGPGQGNGGKTRPFSKDAYSSAKNFVEATFNLKQGEISDIITQSLGEETFYIITRQDERQPSRQKELSEVKDDIKRNVESDMKDTRKKSWMAQLKEEKKVEIFADKIPKDPEPKPESENKSETEVKPAEGESAKTNTDNQAVEKPKESEPAKIDTAKQAVKDEVLAKIGKVTVTLNELNKNISEMPEWKQDRYKDQEGKKKYLDELVEEKLLNVVIYDQKLDKDPEISRQAKEYRDQLMLKERLMIKSKSRIPILQNTTRSIRLNMSNQKRSLLLKSP
jgi:peptidyl-prolyl cis-trans isomerase C